MRLAAVPGRGARGLLPFVFLLSLAGCELQEVTLARPEALLVGEVYLMVGDGQDQVSAFLHSTLGSGDVPKLLTADVRLLVNDTLELPLIRFPSEACLFPEVAQVVEGACFSSVSDLEGVLSPGDRVEVSISIADGRRLRGATVLPGDMEFLRPRGTSTCALGPKRNLPLLWNRSPGAWAYAAEAAIWGLRDAFSGEGTEVQADSIALLGLAISEADTTILFPAEFGVFNRFDLDRDLAAALQEGLPEGATADVAVAALDRNYVNWVRGGNFNPSGAVRVPSLVGDGTGVVGSVVRRVVRVLAIDPVYLPGNLIPNCLTSR